MTSPNPPSGGYKHCSECGRRMVPANFKGSPPPRYVRTRSNGVCEPCAKGAQWHYGSKSIFEVEYEHCVERMEMSDEWLRLKLGMDEDTYERELSRVRQRRAQPWTEADIAYISDTLDQPAEDVAKVLGRSVEAIYSRRRILYKNEREAA